MKKYFFEAQKRQLEKPTEPLYVSCAKAVCTVLAENEAEALVLAEQKFRTQYQGTGVVLGRPVVTKTAELPVDWNYCYDASRRTGSAADREALSGDCVIR